MPREISDEVLLGFVAEARGYLPLIRQGVESYTPGAPPEALEEPYRLIHTIKGAAAMVGFASLSHVAFKLETALEELAAGLLPPTEQTGGLLLQWVDLIDSILTAIERSEAPSPQSVAEAERLDSQLRGCAEVETPLPDEMPAPSSFPTWELPSAPALPLPSFAPPILMPEFSATRDEEEANTPESLPDIVDELASLPLPTWEEPSAVPPGEPAESLFDAPLPDLGAWGASEPVVEPQTQDTPGGPPAPAPVPVVEEQDEVSPELLEVFQLEAAEHLRTITTTLPLLEQQPSNKGHLQEVRRSAHTLKGAAAMVGFRTVTQLAHRMEDALDLLYEGQLAMTPGVLQLLFSSTDALEDLAAGKGVVLDELYQKYAQLLTDQPAAPAAAAEPQPEAEPVAPGFVERRKRQSESMDDLVKLVSEQVIARTVFEQRMADFLRLLTELQPSTERLRRVSYKLETQYEASALGDGGSAPGGIRNRLLRAFQSHGFDDLEFDRYNEFHLLTRELSETSSDIQTLTSELGHLIADFDAYVTQQARLTGEIEAKLMRLRMVPLSMLASRLHRTVRQVATQQGKVVDLVLEGESTGLDRNVLEEMSEPLLHLLRNAVDHGIEPAEMRQARGKAPRGTVRLKAAHEGSQVVIRVTDDGNGLDPQQIRAAAIQKGFLIAPEAEKLSDGEALDLLFQPGFSTAKTVSEISGRGVGLDIVKTRVSRFKGTLSVDSRPGQGTTFILRLPLTMAITRALMVKANQETFAIPLDDIRQILRIGREEIDTVGQEPTLRVAGKVYPVLHLSRVLKLRQPADEAVSRPPVLILHAGDREVALVVDHLLGGREIVVKNLGSHVKRVQGVTGATLLGDGRVVLILNPADLVRTRATVQIASSVPALMRATRAETDWNILIVDDSPSVRRIVSGLIKQVGWKPTTAKNGLEALEVLQQSATPPDLILLDVEMPRMDGYELLSTLRASEAYRDLPVVMLTSRSGEKHRKKAFDLGVSDYLVKPYEDETLLAVVRRLVRRAVPAVTV